MGNPLLFVWSVSSLFGWGVFGLNLMRHWHKIAGAPAFCGGDIHMESLSGMDALRRESLMPALVASEQLKALLTQDPQRANYFKGIVLHSMGNHFSGSAKNAMPFKGQADFGMIFFENTDLPEAAEFCSQYRAIIAGSSWCEEILRARGVNNVATVVQGVDTSLFHPAPRWGALDGRFAVFSGGKLEHRKGQDFVVSAFAIFAARHPEAVLVTAWHSLWPKGALTVNGNPAIAPIALKDDGTPDIAAWVVANKIPAGQFIDLGPVPNYAMPQILREMDVAVFPNRCEGGTNLVAMECMACGIPTIVSDNTGHRDLTATGAPYALARQRPLIVPQMGTEGWGDSDIEEIVEALEFAWRNRADAARRGRDGAEAMSHWTWEHQISKLHTTLSSYCPEARVA